MIVLRKYGLICVWLSLTKTCFHRCSNMKRYRSIFFPSGKPISIARLTMEKGKTVVSTSTMFIYNKSVRIVFQLFIRNDFARLELIEKLVEKREWRCEMTITSMRGKRAQFGFLFISFLFSDIFRFYLFVTAGNNPFFLAWPPCLFTCQSR